jgi:hypothetical protein
VSQWSLIQPVTGNSPSWQTSLQDCFEPAVVVSFDQVNQFVHNDVLQAL